LTCRFKAFIIYTYKASFIGGLNLLCWRLILKNTKEKKIKLTGYLKPYWIYCVLSPILMAGEVMIDLFQPKLMSNIVNESIKDKPFDIARDCIRLSLSPFALSAAEKFLAELENDTPFRFDTVCALCSLLLIEAFRLIGYGEESRKATTSTQSKHRLDLIDNFFDKQLSADANEEELARQLHLSRRQLNRILVASYGMCFREKLLRSKMDRAAFLLRKTEKSISEIAEDVGYLSITAFFKAFKARHGVSPKRYRESFYKSENV